jgi:putative NADH-flavin reductase
MKIVVFGAGGNLGPVVVEEAKSRGHQVTPVTHADADVRDADAIARVAADHDVAISTIGPGSEGDFRVVVDAVEPFLTGLARAGVPRLIVVGGAATLEVAPGVRLLDQPDFHDEWKPPAQAAADALERYRAADTEVDWVFVSPGAVLEPGERTGAYRTGGDQLLVDEQGNSRITYPDFAIALVDEAERSEHHRERFTAAH